jgi:hypothetical protein
MQPTARAVPGAAADAQRYAGRAMNTENLTQWTSLRFDYYLAGRTLLFTNQMQSGVLMLGYAIEAHFKHLISSDRTIERKYSSGHDFSGAFNVLRNAGYLQDVHVSSDLLDFIEDNFDRRYPSQTSRTIKRANSRGRAVSMAPDVIIPYDDFILQLDMSLTNVFGTPEASVLMRGLQNIDCTGGHFFFHCNYAAVARLDTGLDLCEQHLELLKQREPGIYQINLDAHRTRKKLLEDREELLNSSKSSMRIRPHGGFDAALKAAASFVYPGKMVRLNDGTKIHVSKY